MRLRIFKILYSCICFLSDKTNGFRIFVKYKILLGTVILALTNGGCKPIVGLFTCYVPCPRDFEIISNDSISTVEVVKDSIEIHKNIP